MPQESNSIALHVDFQLSWHYLLKRQCFPRCAFPIECSSLLLPRGYWAIWAAWILVRTSWGKGKRVQGQFKVKEILSDYQAGPHRTIFSEQGHLEGGPCPRDCKVSCLGPELRKGKHHHKQKNIPEKLQTQDSLAEAMPPLWRKVPSTWASIYS